MKINLSYITVAFTNLKSILMCPNEFRVCISSSREAWDQRSASIWITYSISFADINIIPQYIVYISGKVLREIKVSSVLLQYYQSTYLYIIYIWGDFT